MTPAGPNRRGPSARRAHRQACARSANSVRCSGLTPKVLKPTRTAVISSRLCIMPGRRLFLRRRHVSAAAVELFGSLWLGRCVFGVLGPLVAEMAGDLFSERAVLGSQAGDL